MFSNSSAFNVNLERNADCSFLDGRRRIVDMILNKAVFRVFENDWRAFKRKILINVDKVVCLNGEIPVASDGLSNRPC